MTGPGLIGWAGGEEKNGPFSSVLSGLGALSVLSACDNTLETGYKYNRLDMTDTEQRAMYADPFSEAAAQAHQEQQDQNASERKPTPGRY